VVDVNPGRGATRAPARNGKSRSARTTGTQAYEGRERKNEKGGDGVNEPLAALTLTLLVGLSVWR
jgi:hypothetical protein